jgi:murein DD-endopeptidase MepM/ murein hydrolase activator NlpD
MSGNRTFKVQKPFMQGQDVKDWQHEIKVRFKKDFGIDCPIKLDGVYGHGTRDFSAALVHAEGLSIKVRMLNGVTPELRALIREGKEPAQAKRTRDSKTRKAYRDKLKKQWARKPKKKVHAPLAHILQDSWGYHPGIHDGEDLICLPNAPTYAMVKCKVIDVRASGWWGLGAPSDPTLKAKGDGIVQMEVLENVGPFKKGMHIGYGHNEKAVVKVGQVLEAGDRVANAGFANAWHIHLMVNNGRSGIRGVGTQDPRPLIDYAVKNG